jgi:hypothetical protein
MSVHAHLPGYRRFRVFQNAGIRTGVYAGVCMSAVLVLWVFVANRVPFSEGFARERNLAAAVLLGFLALVPVFRFLRLPGRLLVSSLIGWGLLSVTYRGLCLYFRALNDRYSAFHIFMMGAVIYMIFATLSWIASCIWRLRESHASHSNHHVS